MHVLMTTDTVSRVWTYTRELVCGLAGRGWRVTLVSFGDIPLPDETLWMRAVKGLDYRPTAFRLDWMQEGQRDFAEACAYLRSLADDLKPDVFHCNHLCYGNSEVCTPRVLVAHGDYLTWWRQAHGREAAHSAWLQWYRLAIAGAISKSNVLVAPTEWMLQQIRTTYGSCVREKVIAPGRNPIQFSPYVTKENSVMTVGRRLDAASQLHLLARCALSVPVYVVEEQQPVSQAETEARTSLVNSDGGFTGPHTEAQLRLLYSRAALYASPGRYEATAMSTLEAALSRCALILNDISPLRELWDDAAVYFSKNDGKALSHAINVLSRDEHLRRDFANRAFERARNRFTAQRMTSKYVELYQTLATRHALAA